MDSVFHNGERAVQEKAGVSSQAGDASGMYRALLTTSVQRFLANQRVAILSSMDGDGRVWASLRTGEPGFLRTVDEHTLEVDTAGAPGDPLEENLAHTNMVGLVAINFAGRQRMRVNGRGVVEPGGLIRVLVERVYGNCPQYIHPRAATTRLSPSHHPPRRSSILDDRQKEWIAKADTFFIASIHPEAGADASHRGGPPGFVHVEGPSRLAFPDYSGNNLFNTLGNIAAYPKAGLLFVDFETGNTLQLSGSARIIWDRARAADERAQRWVEFDIERVIEIHAATDLRFQITS